MFALNAYRAWSRQQPLGSAFATCFLKGSASDVVAQQALDSEEGFDLPRNITFAVFSGAYLGIGQHYVYNARLASGCPAARSRRTLAP